MESVSDRERGIRNDGRRASMVVLNHVWIRMENQKAFKASRMYIENGYKETTWAGGSVVPMRYRRDQVELGNGLRDLILCRLGSFWTAYKLAKLKIIKEEYTTMCPCCEDRGVGETIAHLLCSCNKWREERQKYMLDRQLISVLCSRRLPEDGKCVILLGGECMGKRLENWLPSLPRESDAVGHGQGSSGRECIAFQVARFLENIRPIRYPILRKLERIGRGSLLQSQGPNG